MQPLAFEDELEIALCQRLRGSPFSLRLPIAAVPKHNGAAAVLTLWDCAFEIAIVEGMIFDLDR